MPYPFLVKKWSEEMTVKFITEYVKQECLYNFNHVHFKNKLKRNAAFLHLSSVMGITGFGPQEAYQKIRILRSTFMQEYKKLKLLDNKYISNLKWYPIMYDALIKAHGKIEFKEISTAKVQQFETISLPETEIHDETDCDLDIDTKIGILDEENCRFEVINTNPETSADETKIKTRKRTFDDTIIITGDEIVQHNATQPVAALEHEFDIFGKSIAAQLKNMPLKLAIKAQMRMQNYLSVTRLEGLERSSRESPQPSPPSPH